MISASCFFQSMAGTWAHAAGTKATRRRDSAIPRAAIRMMRGSFSELPKWVGPTLHPQAILHKPHLRLSSGRALRLAFRGRVCAQRRAGGSIWSLLTVRGAGYKPAEGGLAMI